MDPRHTPLHDWHVTQGATMTDFNGWHMPLLYSGMTQEHLQTRKAVGLFDLCHMGRVMVRGPRALDYLARLTPAHLGTARPGQVLYSFLLNEEGFTIDDVTIYVGIDEHMIVVNAGNHDRDVEWMTARAAEQDGVEVEDRSFTWGMVAVQGPASDAVMGGVGLGGASALEYYSHAPFSVDGTDAIVSATGYTGERGYEIYLPTGEVEALWLRLADAAGAVGGGAVGLGARDSLRLEAAMPLFGHELTDDTTPLDAGLGKFVDMERPGFVGRDALLAIRDTGGPERRLVCLAMKQRGPVPRQGTAVCVPGVEDPVGIVTSGIMSPSLGVNVAMAYVDRQWARIGTGLEFDIRGRRHPADVVRRPFYRRSA